MKGVRVDLERAREVANILLPKADELDKEVYKIAGKEFNIKSIPQLTEVFTELGIKFKKTDKGNGSFTEQFLSNLTHPIGRAITNARKCRNIVNNFIIKIIDMQEYTLGIQKEELENTKYGVVYPEFRPFAAVTGRFNCIGPNIQQTPSRDEYLSPLIRSIFIPFEGETWYSLDFSNQEGRLMISDAFTLGCPGALEVVEKFKKDPSYDMHQLVADMIGIKRKEAKAINLGLSYGMGGAKLCKNLNKPTQWMVRTDESRKMFRTKQEAEEYGHQLQLQGYSFEVFEIASREGQEIINDYKKAAPYLDRLISICMESLQRKGYIKTVSGRRCAIDKPILENGKLRTFEYKALNKRIQGSAFDQTAEALIWAYKENIPLLFSVHDEINISSSNPEHAIRLKHIMENAIKLAVPCLTDITSGDSWGACKFS
jgi:DNA polymerase I-like protein with 3'-5' exonuclease and polymerase domains